MMVVAVVLICSSSVAAADAACSCWEPSLGAPFLRPSFNLPSAQEPGTDELPVPGEGEMLIGVANPAAVYCELMGYEYRIEKTKEGEYGVITFPDGTECEEWDFYRGKCGREWSYCAREGWETETSDDGRDPFSREYAICIGDDGEVIGSVTELIELGEVLRRGAIIVPVEEEDDEEQVWTPPLRRVRDVPSSFDWRDFEGGDWMTPVKNQGSCPLCWAFSAVGVSEAVHDIYWNDPDLNLDFSEQVFASSGEGPCYGWGCNPGGSTNALNFMICGIVDEACFPYTASGSTPCSDMCTDWLDRLNYIDGYDYNVPTDPDSMKRAIVQRGPLSVNMAYDFGAVEWGYFDGDVYRCDEAHGGYDINHAVVIAGYDDAGSYWIVKNSYGTGWGDNGYFKVGYGECSIQGNPIVAIFTNKPFPPVPENLMERVYADCSASGYQDGTIDFPFSTIQEAILAAADGAVVHVAAGLYTGEGNRDIGIPRRSMKVIGAGADQTIIDCEGEGRGLTIGAGLSFFYDPEEYQLPCYGIDDATPDSTTVLRGFTIRNASSSGIRTSGTSIIKDCVLTGNSAGKGGGMLCDNSSPTVVGCVFSDNEATLYGGGVECFYGGSPHFTDCVFSGNSGPKNGGGAVALYGADDVQFVNCTFVDNTYGILGYSGYGGTAIWVAECDPLISNCIFAFNGPPNISSGGSELIDCQWGGENPEITHCCVFANDPSDSLCGNYHDNLFVDPLFCDLDAGEFSVYDTSPCLPENNAWGEQIGALAMGCAAPGWYDVTAGPLGDGANDSNGISWGDYDNDGDQDLFLSNHVGTDKLLRNDGWRVFEDVTQAPMGENWHSKSAPWGDYNNDGNLDVYLTQSADDPNELYRNDGNGEFTLVDASPLNDTGNGRSSPWVDYDRDGLLDLYIGNSGENRLLRNLGDDVFADVTVPPLDDGGNCSAAVWGDYNNDGEADLYIVNVGTPNILVRNDGNGAFTDVSTSPVNDSGDGWSAVWGDYDNDGDLDLYLGNSGENKLFRNDDGVFVDATEGPLGGTDETRGVAWCDFDNDGDLDLYIANEGPNRLLTNDPILGFWDITSVPLDDPGTARGVAWADCDGDGQLDLYIANNGANRLLWNMTSPSTHWLHVELRGVLSNWSAIGARVRILAEGKTQIREVNGGSGFRSQDSLPVEFGLFGTAVVDSLVIRWPSGQVNRYSGIAADQYIVLEENMPPSAPHGLAAVPGEESIEISWLAPADTDLDHYRIERDVSDVFDAAVEFVTSDTSYVDSPLDNGTTYWYRVFAVDSAEQESAPSETLSCVPGVPPAAPSALAADVQEGIITVSWASNHEPDFDHYVLHRDTTEFFDGELEETALPDTTRTEYPLLDGTTYYYRVFSVDADALVSDPSETVSCVTIQTAPPAPAGPFLAVGDNCITVTWREVSVPDFMQYHVERDTTAAFGSGSTSQALVDTFLVDCLVADGQDYYYRIRSEDLAGILGQPSDVVSGVASQMPPPPPQSVQAVAGPTDEEITVTWASVDVPDFDHFQVDRDTTDAFGAGTMSFVRTDTSFVDGPLTIGRGYWYRVYATDLMGLAGAMSETVHCIAGIPPPAPVNLTAVSTEGSVFLDWMCSVPPDFDHYLVQRDTSSLFGQGTLEVERSGSSWRDLDILHGEEYFYRVMAVDIHDLVSAPSGTVSCVATQTTPQAPWGLIASAGTDAAQLDWHAVLPPDFSHCAVERDTSLLFGPGIVEYAAADTSFTDYTIADSVEYYYRIRIVDLSGLSSTPSDTASYIGTQSPPSVPEGLTAIGNNSSVSLEWDDIPEADVAGYSVYRDTTASFAAPESLAFCESSEFSDQDCEDYRRYWYSVASRDQSGLVSACCETLLAMPVPGGAVCVDNVNATPLQDGSISNPYDFIQEGVDAAGFGDAVVVFPGVYPEQVTLKNGTATLALRGPEMTVIETSVTGSALGSGTRFWGFTVDGVNVVQAALEVHSSDLIVQDCMFRNATSGASIDGDSEVMITDCVFLENSFGIAISDSAYPCVVSSEFSDNAMCHVNVLDSASLLLGGSLVGASDLLPGPALRVLNQGTGDVIAEYNWWGDVCPESGWFIGSVDYIPWTDELHMETYYECPTGVDGDEVPERQALSQNFPNPFNPTTQISYDVPSPGARVVLRIYAPTGRLVRTLTDADVPPGRYSDQWDGCDERGKQMSSGVYLYRIQIGEFTDQRKMVLLK